MSWDKPLSEKLCRKWNEILTQLKLLSTLKIERCVACVDTAEQYKLFVFFDASMKSYAAAIYLHVDQKARFCQGGLYLSKMRLVSKSSNKLKKDITLPRLELLAVNISIRAANFVARELTDSTCVLHWLETSKPLPTVLLLKIE